MSNKETRFSVLMSVYYKENPNYLKRALDSIIHQTLPPNEIVLVEDGPLTEDLYSVIAEYTSHNPILFNVVKLEKNQGLGLALREGVNRSTYDLIARMDSDDVSLPYRFEKQISFFEQHDDVDILGGICTEFFDEEDNIVSKAVLPQSHEDIVELMGKKCAMSHVTVMFKRQSVLNAGNYRDYFWDEDYDLWVRMLSAGCRFANLADVLVNVRSGINQYARRGGKRYFRSEKGVQKYMLDHKMISPLRYANNVFIRFVVQMLMPSRVRGWSYKIYRKISKRNSDI